MHNMAFMFTFNNTMVEWISHHIDFCTAIQKKRQLGAYLSFIYGLRRTSTGFFKYYTY